MTRFISILGVIALILAGVTYLMHRVFQKNRLIKYLPPIILLFLGVYNIYSSTKPSTGFEDLGRIILAIMLFTGFAAGIVTGLTFDFVMPRFKKGK